MPSPWFRSTQWLFERLKAPDIVIVDASWYLPPLNRSGANEYLEKHIKGAIHFDIDVIKDDKSDLPHMMPSAIKFASSVKKLGIGDGQTIVVYDGAGLFAAPRVWWMFRAFGVERVFILEGGLPKWEAEGKPVESGLVTRMPRHFTPRLNHSMIADMSDIKAQKAQVVDARPAARFKGEAPEPRPGVRAGHIPQSKNVPFDQIVKDGLLVSDTEIKAALAAGGVDISKPIITSCGSGVSAAILYVALESVGATPDAIYDGSWAEWGSTEGCEVAVGSSK